MTTDLGLRALGRKEAEPTAPINQNEYTALSPEMVVNFIRPEFGIIIDLSAVLDKKLDQDGKRYAIFKRRLKPYKGLTEEKDEKEEALKVEVNDLIATADWILQELNEMGEAGPIWNSQTAIRRYTRLTTAGLIITTLSMSGQFPRPKIT